MSEMDIQSSGLQALRVTQAYFGRVAYPAGSTLGPRTQPDVQLVMVDQGAITLELDDQSHRMGPGGVFILWPGGRELFQFDRRRRTVHRWVTLVVADDLATTGGWQALRRTLPFVQVESPALRRLQALGRQMDGQGVARDSLAMIHLARAYLAGYMTLGQQAVRADEPSCPPAVTKAERHMMAHLARPMTLADLAHAASVTPHHLVRLFGRHRGMTPMRRLWEARVLRGAYLLRHTGLSVSQVADQVGFASAFHFSRRMRQRLGHSPTQWRELHWRPTRGRL